jgi:hypothetical protein
MCGARVSFAKISSPSFKADRDAAAIAAGSVGANGLYVIDGIHGGDIDRAVLNSTNIDGVLMELPWSTIEPSEGSFNWSALDAVLAQAASVGKRVSVIFGAGWQTPSWVYADGAQKFNFIWEQTTWGPKLCSVTSIPVPWDAVYLAKWQTLVEAAGARYDSNSTVASVKITGLNSKTQEIFLPRSVNKTITSGSTSCVSYDDLADWQAVGYTSLKAEAAWQSVIQIFVAAFPQKKLEAMLVPGGFPAIDDNGNRFKSGNNQNDEVTIDIVTRGVSAYPSQFTFQNDGWSKWIWKTEASYANQVTTGYQENTALGSQTSAAITAALNAGATYLEFYESDVLSPTAQTALGSAHAVLQ